MMKIQSSDHSDVSEMTTNYELWECTRCNTGLRDIADSSISTREIGCKRIVQLHEKNQNCNVRKYTKTEAEKITRKKHLYKI